MIAESTVVLPKMAIGPEEWQAKSDMDERSNNSMELAQPDHA